MLGPPVASSHSKALSQSVLGVLSFCFPLIHVLHKALNVHLRSNQGIAFHGALLCCGRTHLSDYFSGGEAHHGGQCLSSGPQPSAWEWTTWKPS